LQQARPKSAVAPEEWNLLPPEEPVKKTRKPENPLSGVFSK
jgi:hypothetical protein